jgi:hypothetical protein
VFASSPDLAAFVEQLPTARGHAPGGLPTGRGRVPGGARGRVAQREPVAEALAGAQRYAEQWLAEGGGARVTRTDAWRDRLAALSPRQLPLLPKILAAFLVVLALATVLTQLFETRLVRAEAG